MLFEKNQNKQINFKPIVHRVRGVMLLGMDAPSASAGASWSCLNASNTEDVFIF